MQREKCFQHEYLSLPCFNRCFAVLLQVTIPLRIVAITQQRRRNIEKHSTSTLLLPRAGISALCRVLHFLLSRNIFTEKAH